MIRWQKFIIFFTITTVVSLKLHAYSEPPSRTRGAVLFMNYCSGCHSLRYLSWSRMVNDLQLTSNNTVQIKPHVNLSLPNLSPTWPEIGLASWDAKQWFGKPPPDLSLISRQRGSAWVTTYLLSFYPDPKQRFGVNNQRFPYSMMPHVLESLQKELPAADFAAVVADIVYFLEYAAEPAVLERTRIGWFVVGFLLILCGLYWLRIRELRR
jgi:ubiquinol-cytochrome c reductase cytochrome c1 subunit